MRKIGEGVIMNISILKDMFDTHIYKIMELEKDSSNEEAHNDAIVMREAFSAKLKSLGIRVCGYDGSIFVICYEDGRIETI